MNVVSLNKKIIMAGTHRLNPQPSVGEKECNADIDLVILKDDGGYRGHGLHFETLWLITFLTRFLILFPPECQCVSDIVF